MPEKKAPKLIWVKGTGKDGKVLLFERDDAHPPTLNADGEDAGRHHEAFVPNDGYAYQVAETALVKRLMGEGVLVEGSESESYQNQRVNWNSMVEEGDTIPPKKNGRGRKAVPALRKATDLEEQNAVPPVKGSPDEDTAQVPVS